MIFNNLVSPSVFDVLLVFITLLGISFCLIAVLKLHLLLLLLLLFSANIGNLEFARCLVESGADVNAKDCQGKTALAHAIEIKNDEVIRYLTDQGA